MKIIDSYKVHALIKKINEALDPELENRLRKDLKKHCEEAGKDFEAICKLAGLATKGYGALPSDVVNFIDNKADGEWHYDSKTGRINVDGTFTVQNGGYGDYRNPSDVLPLLKKVHFGKINGDFNFIGMELTDEIWNNICPLEVNGKINISNNILEAVILPPKVDGGIQMSRNKLKSLEGSPEICEGDFRCELNNLPNLEGGPKETKGDYICTEQRDLGESRFILIGCAEKIHGNFECTHNRLTSLEGGPVEVGGVLKLHHNELVDLKGSLRKVMTDSGYGNIDVQYNRLATLEGLPLGVSGYSIECGKNMMQANVMKSTYRDATSMKSWIAAYLKLAATQRFKRMSKAQRDPIVERITPELIAKNPIALAPIWKDEELLNDPVIKRRIKQSGITKDDAFKKDIGLSSDLLDLGF